MSGEPVDAARMRAYLLDRLRIDVQIGGFDQSDLLAVLSPMPADSAWRDYRSVTDPEDGAWFLWREPGGVGERVHADRVAVDGGQIVGKHGCGLGFYTECAPLAMPDDVARILAEGGQSA